MQAVIVCGAVVAAPGAIGEERTELGQIVQIETRRVVHVAVLAFAENGARLPRPICTHQFLIESLLLLVNKSLNVTGRVSSLHAGCVGVDSVDDGTELGALTLGVGVDRRPFGAQLRVVAQLLLPALAHAASQRAHRLRIIALPITLDHTCFPINHYSFITFIILKNIIFFIIIFFL